MGDPKKQKKKYQTPPHPWEKVRIDEERILVKEYGFKNKKEIWKMKSVLLGFIERTRKLIANTSKQAEKEKVQLLNRLASYGLITKTSKLEDVLSLTPKDIMERRLQTLVYRKGLAKTMNQSRQFIVHGHIAIGDKKITAPSYLVVKTEEPKICFSQLSQISAEDHPERIAGKAVAVKTIAGKAK